MLLLNNNLFSKFPPAEIGEETWNMLIRKGTSHRYKRREQLLIDHQQINKLLCITKGRVKNSGLFSNGKEMIFELLEAPAIIGYHALFIDHPDSSFPYIVALDNTECVFVPIEEAEKIIYATPELMRAIIISITNTLTITRQQASWNRYLNCTQKVAFAFMQTKYTLKDASGYFRITHEDIAGFVGISRANATAAINKLHSLGLIDKQFGKIKVLDMNKLDIFIHDPDSLLV